ncbi:uncharacterized protein RHOBADRAFT_40798 [Rhodotorula graminis WP1]|uniref:Uncharacterized protein n=1 Tax=Rhodotorula graminis (strain WP1) TaxID=578459 RepID=A0A194SCC0_RHOGW|nr:uncharacterized protein RHOBADRAFT_40798 [Rhodotorula graminis WP1]KPV78249.1 hypothetical protein RHOBADRAFT_40798 [Rhodotorula graminis WP1]
MPPSPVHTTPPHTPHPLAEGTTCAPPPRPASPPPSPVSQDPPSLAAAPPRPAPPVEPFSPPPSPVLYRPPHLRQPPLPPTHDPSSSTLPWRTRPPSPTTPRSTARPLLEAHGDSFVSVFGLLGFKVKVFKYSGASARGLNSSTSKLGVGPQLVARLEAERPPHVLLQFATVDLAINYLWQLKARGAAASSPDAWTDKVVADYTAFLASRIVPLASRERLKVYVVAACPPVVEDRYLEAMADKYLFKAADARTLLPLSSASHPHDLDTRSRMVRRFNAALDAFCAEHECLSFVDITEELVTSGAEEGQTPRVREEYVDRVDPTNVHLLWEPTLSLWVRAVAPLAHLAASLDAERLGRSAEEYEREKRERVERRGSGSGAGA